MSHRIPGPPLQQPKRGEIWLAALDKRRPVVVMHRDFAGRSLQSVLVAPVTTTVRDIPTAVRMEATDGLDRDCVASLDNLTLVMRTRLIRKIGQATPARMDAFCRALAVALACRFE